MNEQQANVLKATVAVAAARARLTGTLAAVQGRLKPRSIVRRTQAGASGAGQRLIDTARTNPAASAGVAVIGLLVLRRLTRRRPRPARVPAAAKSSFT